MADDIKSLFKELHQTAAKWAQHDPSQASQFMMVRVALAVLEPLMADVNRIANAIEKIAETAAEDEE